MDISSLISSTFKGDAPSKIANSLGIESGTAQKLIALGIPLLIQQIHKNAQTPEGVEALEKALNNHTKAKTNIEEIISPVNLAEGKKIINHILGNETESTTAELAKKVGVSEAQVTGLLAELAPLLMGIIGEKRVSSKLDTTGLIKLLSKTIGTTSEKSVLSSLTISLLDKNGDGKVQDDIIRIGINWLKNRFRGK
ncbi:DUF937 domain-containing protein [Candidatus Gracilibacteria bacterium]|nr:DUF937 domain-containing protein [Candidatus Gracilibacteria bacterium]